MRQEVYPGVVIDSKIVHGKPSIAGTRIPVTVILGTLAAGDSLEGACDAYGVTPEQVRAVLGYALQVIEQTIEGASSGLSQEEEAIFEEEFEDGLPGLRHLQDK